MRPCRTLLIAAAVAAMASLAGGCATAVRPPRPSAGELRRARELMNSPAVIAAFAAVDRDRDHILSEWRMLTEIPAPSGHEESRAAEVVSLLRTAGLEPQRDSAGNVWAVRRGSGGGPTVVLDAHLDTVFQAGTAIRTEVRGGRIYAPGVGDDTRNVEAILAAARALQAASAVTRGDIIFLFTVEEETSFRGVHQFLKDHRSEIGSFVALDGGFEGFTYGGIGIDWLKIHLLGPGGHTRSSTPPYSATLPLARAIERVYRMRVPSEPPSFLNIGMVGGSAVVNAKADDAWFTADVRSTSDSVMARIEREIGAIAAQEARRTGMTSRIEVLSAERAAQIPGHRTSRMVLATEAVHLALGFENPPITPTASNHASAALLAGVPAISTGSAPCNGSHSLSENCEIEPIYRGIRKAILLAVDLADGPPSAE